MSIQELSLLLVSIAAAVTGQFFLKTGALKLGKVTAENALHLVLNIASTPELLIGLAAYGMGAITYILLLTRVNLSVVAPSSALSYVFPVLIGYFVFNETISITRAIGIGLIMCGVILVIYQKS